MIDARNGVNDGTPASVTRYQLSNHLDSAVMELGQTGRTLSYEEYHPYGTTAYQAMDSSLPVSARRYRYTGKERDEESGLYYHGARYYVPWIARWASADPLGIGDGVDVYAYVRGNPVGLQDPSGEAVTQPSTFEEADVVKATQPEKEAPQRESSQNAGSANAENTSPEPDPSVQCAAKNPKGLDITELDEPVHYSDVARAYDRTEVTETREKTLEIDTVSGGAAAAYTPEIDIGRSGSERRLVVHYKLKLDPKYVNNLRDQAKSVVVPWWDPELKAHEETHLRIHQLALRSELQKDPRTQTASSPAEVEKLLRNASKRAFGEISQLVNAKYDIRTIHGTESRPQNRWQRERKLERQIRRAERFRKRHPKWFKKRLSSLVDRAKKLEAKAEVLRIEALRGINE
jgi:RHS repeat-associated protein